MSTRRLLPLRSRTTRVELEARLAAQVKSMRLGAMVSAGSTITPACDGGHPLKIGIAGTGRMGAAMAGRLLGCGHEVSVWNRTPEKTAPLEAAGANVAATPAGLASGCEAVIPVLTDAAAIDARYCG